MPKKVDHDERRQQIAEALWRIASTRGLESASLRDVAAEAGISLGRLQHYFTTKDEMLVFALDHIGKLSERRVIARIRALSGSPSPREVVRETLAEMLPLDDKSRSGILVQIAYFIRAVHDERLRATAKEGIPALRAFIAGRLREAVQNGQIAPHRDPDDEAMLLIALVDGLTTYVLLEVHTPEEALRLLDRHLDQLFS
ncbi:TetR/AcrR family transcriptional regulator [Sphaerisporangium fuscum]|uniref:TetR/AcrR family transcriptional regulator n=1 Tax=Sphaerisporangium fuscum TaxID=2835868 RepID=UPI001BDC7C35|nr:TetR family transcriptional regulator C-terminal domain-containing protein [Sphaerisporangium fuscum]